MVASARNSDRVNAFFLPETVRKVEAQVRMIADRKRQIGIQWPIALYRSTMDSNTNISTNLLKSAEPQGTGTPRKCREGNTWHWDTFRLLLRI
jgi:hypothetical protein